MERYIGLDAHTSSCTVAVIGQSGKRLQSQVLETNAKALIDVIRAVPKDRHLCLEEGPNSNWLYEVLSPHVQEIVVALVNETRGPKSDKLDAFGLAERLRIGAIRTKVYKKRGGFGRLGYRVKAHALLVADSVRVQSRIKALLRSRGIATAGAAVYSTGERGEWLSKLPQSARSLAELLYMEYDSVEGLRQRAEREMIAEARKHDVYRIIRTCPGIGEIRAAQILPVVVTPFRFANKRVFWSYCGLGIVMRSSSDWVRGRDGQWVRAPIQQTRGLNRNFNRMLKDVFKGAATTVIGRAQDEPLYRHYVSLLDGRTKPNLAKLTIARQIAAIVLALWRSMEVYDPKRLGHAT